MHCLFVVVTELVPINTNIPSTLPICIICILYYLYSVLSVFCIICMATIWPTNLETVMEKRHALGGARTLGKLDESSTGARLSAQMRGRVTRKNSAGVRLSTSERTDGLCVYTEAISRVCVCVCM